MPGTYKHPASARACMSCHFWGNLGGPDVPALSSILDLHSHNAASIDALPPKMAGKTWQKKSEKTCVQWWWSTCTYACPCRLGRNYRFIVHPHRKAWKQPYIRGSWTCMSVISHYWYHMTVYDHVYTRPSLAQKNLEHFFWPQQTSRKKWNEQK